MKICVTLTPEEVAQAVKEYAAIKFEDVFGADSRWIVREKAQPMEEFPPLELLFDPASKPPEKEEP